MEKYRPPLGNDGRNSSGNSSDEGNRRVGRTKHGRREQPGMEMGEEIRPFQEKGRRGAQRHPFGVGWWCWGGIAEVLGLWGGEQPGKGRGWRR